MAVNDFSIVGAGRDVGAGLGQLAEAVQQAAERKSRAVEDGEFGLDVQLRLRCAEIAAIRLQGIPLDTLGTPRLTILADQVLTWVSNT